MKLIGTLLSALVALAFLSIGLGAVVFARPSSEQYGLPTDDPSALAYVRALGARDAVLGLAVAYLAATRARGPLAALIGMSTLVGAADFLIVFAERGPEARRNLAIHGTGAAGLLATWAALERRI